MTTKWSITSRYDQKATWQKVEEQEWVAMSTDKSRHLTDNSKLNYLERLVTVGV
jgi:hypothetical protein